MTIQDTSVKIKSVSSWSWSPIKNRSKKKKSCRLTFILKRVTRFRIFFLGCSIISNNSENEYIFIERTRRPRSTPQPLTTKTTSTLLRTQSTNTQNKLLSVGKVYFDWNMTFNMTLVILDAQHSSNVAFQTPLSAYLKRVETLDIYIYIYIYIYI